MIFIFQEKTLSKPPISLQQMAELVNVIFFSLPNFSIRLPEIDLHMIPACRPFPKVGTTDDRAKAGL